MSRQRFTGHHAATAKKILSHPSGHNIEWHDAASLLAEMGAITEEANGRFVVTLGGESKVFDRSRSKDLDIQQVVDLRRMLVAAGVTLDSLDS